MAGARWRTSSPNGAPKPPPITRRDGARPRLVRTAFFLLGERGADVVEARLDESSHCSAATWSEVAQKAAARGLNWRATRQLLLGWDLKIEPVTLADAEAAAVMWAKPPSLSLADRLCLATAARLDASVWTADTAWGDQARIHQIR